MKSTPRLPATVLCLALFLTGCVGLLPVPENHPTYGTRLRSGDTAFIRAGTTSATDLFRTLGTNCVCDARQRAVAYSWELSGGHSLWWVVFMQAGAAGEMEWSHWRGFFVAFDTNNIVAVSAHKNLSSRKSLHEQLETWARKNHAASDRMHPETILAQTP